MLSGDRKHFYDDVVFFYEQTVFWFSKFNSGFNTCRHRICHNQYSRNK